jgi:intergrase/recombinase
MLKGTGTLHWYVTLRSRSPSYITQNALGIFIFQYRFPKQIRDFCPSLPTFFRRSLRTRCKRSAEAEAKRWWVILDEVSRRFFNDPTSYSKAVELLASYEKLEHQSWGMVEDYLAGLDDAETELLDKALVCRKEQEKTHQQLLEEVAALKQTVAALSAGLPITSPYAANKVATHSTASPAKQTAPLSGLDEDLPLSLAIKRFLEYKKRNVKKVSWTAIEFKTRWFLEILTEFNNGKVPKVSELNHPKIRIFREVLLQMPRNRRNLPMDCSIKAMLKMDLTPISQQTAHTTCVVVGELLTWIQSEGYPIQRELKGVLAAVKKPKVAERNKRLTFEPNDIRQLFLSDRYLKGKVKRASEYWVPLLALFTGARLGELNQLNCSDLYAQDGVWIFDINDDSDDKQLKTEKSRRMVPIHSQLIELGLIDFAKQRGRTNKRLFPEEERNGEGKFDAFTKRFAYYRSKQGVVSGDGEMLDFHSFRHTVRTKLADASVPESLIDDIIGHTSNNSSVGKTVYTHTQLIPQKQAAIEKITYDLDFGKLKRWDQCRFQRDLPSK